MNTSSSSFRTLFLTGMAGTGKTYQVRKNIERDPTKAILCATTGVAALNLSESGDVGEVVTINSLLKYFDEDSLLESYAKGSLRGRLIQLSKRARNIAIDECSMLTSLSLDTIYDCLVDINNLKEVQEKGGLGIWLVGDVCQLPPIKGKFCFHARCWRDTFAEETIKLTKVFRQSDKGFLDALNHARRGDGDKTAEILVDLGTKFSNYGEEGLLKFDGTVIVATNAEVDRINNARLLKLLSEDAREINYTNYRWGRQRNEWSIIPETLTICEGSRVMVLSNDVPDFTYANGTCGEVVVGDEGKGLADIRKDGREGRDGGIVEVKRVSRLIRTDETPEGYTTPEYMSRKGYREYLEMKEGKENVPKGDEFTTTYDTYLMLKTMEDRRRNARGTPYFDYVLGKWVVGGITYMPLRLGYASTVHKTQGLTLDKVLIDYKHNFFSKPAMSYVALSRVRSHGGLVINSSPGRLGDMTNVSREVLEWI